jgi:copper homeostasis protein
MPSSGLGSDLVIEVCVDSVESAIAAQRGGADRVELCTNLLDGGTTPSSGAIEMARKNLSIPLHILIRPRSGDFLYSETDLAVMKRDIAMAKRLGADGIAIGMLSREGAVDTQRTRESIETARPLSVTFHRAFDMSRDPFQSLEDLIALGVDRVLTSGQEATVVEGLLVLERLVKLAGTRIRVMAGGGLTEHNVKTVVSGAGVRELHFTARTSIESTMTFRNTRVVLGSAVQPEEYRRLAADSERVRKMKQQAEAAF